jgi:hypothetical protein
MDDRQRGDPRNGAPNLPVAGPVASPRTDARTSPAMPATTVTLKVASAFLLLYNWLKEEEGR